MLNKHLPAINDYWSVKRGLDNLLIQKVMMTRAQFWKILQNMHFVDYLQKLPIIDSNMIVYENSNSCLTTY